jgi:hypothetical protein
MVLNAKYPRMLPATAAMKRANLFVLDLPVCSVLKLEVDITRPDDRRDSGVKQVN